jgi:hypothetical protein
MHRGFWRDSFRGYPFIAPLAPEEIHMRTTILRAGVIFAIGAAMTACGSDSTAPDASIAGSYTATEFVTTGGSGQRNELLAGSTVTMVLNANGTTSGHLHVAASGSSPALDADMAGTWTRSGNVVDFTQAADTFVRDMAFTLQTTGSKWVLIGDQGFSGTRVQLTLTQT